MTGHLAFFVVILAVALRAVLALRNGGFDRSVISAIGLFIYGFCMWLPAYLQNQGSLDSKLQDAGFLAPPTATEFDQLAFLWATELAVLVCAEIAGAFFYGVLNRRNPRFSAVAVGIQQTAYRTSSVSGLTAPDESWRNSKKISFILLLIGFAATMLFSTSGLESRGLGGQGIQILLRTCLVSGLAMLVFFRCFSSKVCVALLLSGTAFLFISNVRSPLVVLFLAYIASEIARRRNGFSLKRSGLILGLVVLVALVGSFMSTMRANITRNYGQSVGEVLSQTLSDPLIAIYSSGIDTLDGYRFSAAIARVEPSRPSDLLLIVLTFIPRSVWPDKPNSLSVDLSAKYLGYNSSGQFLSPMGYLNLVWGSYGVALLSLFVFGLVFSMLMSRFRSTFWTCLLLVVVFRFLLGGSSFDVYYGIVLAAPVFVVKSIVDSMQRQQGQLQFRQVTPTGHRSATGWRIDAMPRAKLDSK